MAAEKLNGEEVKKQIKEATDALAKATERLENLQNKCTHEDKKLLGIYDGMHKFTCLSCGKGILEQR
jgi:hypothetical protein